MTLKLNNHKTQPHKIGPWRITPLVKSATEEEKADAVLSSQYVKKRCTGSNQSKNRDSESQTQRIFLLKRRNDQGSLGRVVMYRQNSVLRNPKGLSSARLPSFLPFFLLSVQTYFIEFQGKERMRNKRLVV